MFSKSRQFFFILLLFATATVSNVIASDNYAKGVLVASRKSQISELTQIDVRRLFLGLAADSSSGVQSPVINESDMGCYREFLKNVMYLTENGYQKKLVKRIFRLGADEILQFEKEADLIAHLKKHPGDISFMCMKDKAVVSSLKVIKVLWQ